MSVLTLVLAGGTARALSVLTQDRAKPMLPFGGKYRVIDFVLSNAANSGLQQIGLLAQYHPHSLIEHVGAGEPWGFDLHQSGLQVWLASIERTGQAQYTGTADAVYQNRRAMLDAGCEQTLILAADHVYLQDYRPLIDFHQRMGAEVTIVTMPRPERAEKRFGLLDANDQQVITHFVEKPEQPAGALASLGIYVFNTPELVRRLEEDAVQPGSSHDFGRDILPRIVADGRAYSYPYDGFWADIGSLQDYWETSMALLQESPAINLNDASWPVRSRLKDNGPASIWPNGQVINCLISGEARVAGEVRRSILGPGVQIENGAMVRNSVLMANVVVGAGALIEDCVLDEGVSVGAGAVIGAGQEFTPNAAEPDLLHSGLTVIGAGTRIPASTVIGRNCQIGKNLDPDDFPGRKIASGSSLSKPN